MTSLNNLKGHITKIDFEEFYCEKLTDELYFSLFYKYESKCHSNTENVDHSSVLEMFAVVHNGTRHEWQNGVISLEGEQIGEILSSSNKLEDERFGPYPNKYWNVVDNFSELKKLKTKDGLDVYQVELMKRSDERFLQWIVEVPIKYMIEKFTKCGDLKNENR